MKLDFLSCRADTSKIVIPKVLTLHVHCSSSFSCCKQVLFTNFLYNKSVFKTEHAEEESEAGALVSATEKALQLRDNQNSLTVGTARTGAEFFAARSFQGLDISNGGSQPEPYLIGRSGKASGYRDEKNRQEEKC